MDSALAVVMNFKYLSNTTLIEKTKALAARERELGVQVIHHLREIEARQLFIPAGFSSLFDFTVKILGYTEGAADRRIKAMRLLSALPKTESLKIEASLSAGELSLSNLSALQRFFVTEKKDRQRSYSVPERLALIEELKRKSAREAERVLVKHSPESARTKLHFTADEVLTKKLERLKELLSHQLPTQDMNALLNKLADMALKTLEKESTPASECTGAASAQPNALATEQPKPNRSTNPRYIPAKLKAALMRKAQNQCQYTDPKSGQRCSTRHYLQIDHITPVAYGGAASPQNLRVLCAAHNRYAAFALGLT
jgi:hypothetical protein